MPKPSHTPMPPQGFTVAFPEPGPPPVVPPAAWVALGARMAAAFTAAATVTAALLLVPWIWLVSPGLDGARQAYHASLVPDAEVVEVQVEVPVPVPVPVPVAAEPADAPKQPPAVARVAPKPVRTAPVPAAVVKSPAPVEPKPLAQPIAAATPVVSAAPPVPVPAVDVPAPPPETPAAARRLEGSMSGSSGGRALAMRLDFKPGGRLAAKITRAGGKTVDAFGTYSLKGNRSAITLVEPGERGATYTGTVNGTGASGHIHYSDGKTRRFKVKR